MLKHLFALLISLFLSSHHCNAQFVSFGQDPASYKWKQIQTNDFQIIYPNFYEENAQKVANIFDELYQFSKNRGVNIQPISLILHCGGGVSNGNVAMAPRKGELYTIPSYEATDSWLEHLCTHEFRHVEQIDIVNQDITKKIYYLFGEIFPTAVIGLYVPMWYLEGDAVAFESSVLPMGRGRSPEFLNEVKAQVVEQGVYPFQKAILGSYKDYVPNRYNFGYFMVSKTKERFGREIWDKALQYAGDHPFSFNPIQKSLKNSINSHYDLSVKDKSSFRYKGTLRTLYHDNFDRMREEWIAELESTQYNTFDTITPHAKYYTNFFSPMKMNSKKILAHREGMANLGEFVTISSQGISPIVSTSILGDKQYVYKDSQLVWTEYIPHIRWEHAGRMKLTSYDMKRKKRKHYNLKNNAYAPFIYGDNYGVVTVDENNMCHVLHLSSQFQIIDTLYSGKEQELILHPKVENGKLIAISQTPQGLQVVAINRNQLEALSSITTHEIDHPFIYKGKLGYRSAANGNNEIVIVDSSNNTQSLMKTPFGVNYPSISSDSSLSFSFYTSNGYKIGSIDTIRPMVYQSKKNPYPLAATTTEQTDFQITSKSDSTYATSRYRKGGHLINIHSWGPAVIDYESNEADFGLALYSQNLLSTFFLSGGYALETGYEFGKIFFDASYQGLFPIFDIKFESGRTKSDYLTSAKNNITGESSTLYIENRAQLSSGIIQTRVLFSFLRGHFMQKIQPSITYRVEGYHNNHVRNAYIYSKEDNSITLIDKYNYDIPTPDRYYQLLEYGLFLANQKRTTATQQWPRWSQTLQLGYTQPLSNKDQYSTQWWLQSNNYFPGIASTHALNIYFGYQMMQDKIRTYSNKIRSPRGTSLYGYEMMTLASTYNLPIANIDWAIGSSWYIRNFNAGLFYDFGKESHIVNSSTFQSYGTELSFKSYLLRLPFQIETGIRVGYETQNNNIFANFLFGMSVDL